jgi:hypothetical protein
MIEDTDSFLDISLDESWENIVDPDTLWEKRRSERR